MDGLVGLYREGLKREIELKIIGLWNSPSYERQKKGGKN